MRGVSCECFQGRPAVLKVYRAEDTDRFMCIGSGARNEALIPDRIADLAPELIHFEQTAGSEISLLAREVGRVLLPQELTPTHAGHAGEMLGRIHACTSRSFGSLDASYRYPTLADAFAPRWRVAMDLLAGLSTQFARAVDRWAQPRIEALASDRPRLVHGDFGPGNIVWRDQDARPIALDWEHARFGDPREDWSKILLAARFPEANGFGASPAVYRSLENGWRAAFGAPECTFGA